MMRAPDFWWRTPPGMAALALAPAGLLWGAITARRMRRKGSDAPIPVICIGNFVAGGAGKTPTALACARLIAAAGLRPVFLSRGYGGQIGKAGRPQRIDPERHSADEAGDEPLLLAQLAPTIVSGDRAAGAEAAAALGADVIVMDDGLQNPSLNKTLSLAVVDGATAAGNGLCIPAGPLRAPLEAQLPLVGGLVVIGAGAAGERLAGRALSHGKAVFMARLRPDREAADRLRGRKVVAFAGIGRPEKFFTTLEEVGAEIVEAFGFGDHEALTAANIAELRAKARAASAILVTTEKDFVRLADSFAEEPPAVLPVSVEFEDEPGFAGFLLRAIEADRRSRRGS